MIPAAGGASRNGSGGTPVVGWIGSPTTASYLSGLGPVLRRVGERHRARRRQAQRSLGEARDPPAHDEADRYGDRVTAKPIDCKDRAAVVELMRGHASAISCVNYWLNEKLARAAIEAVAWIGLTLRAGVHAGEFELVGERYASGFGPFVQQRSWSTAKGTP